MPAPRPSPQAPAFPAPAFPLALARALADLMDGPLLRLLIAVLALTLVLFTTVAALAAWAAERLVAPLLPAGWQTAGGWLSAALGGGLVVLAAWFGFAALAMAVAGGLTDVVARMVERRRWPDRPPAPGIPWWRDLALSLRFLGLTAVVNLVVLPLLLLPPVGEMAFIAANAWLVGRQTFLGLAGRRLPPEAVRMLYQQARTRIFCAGLIIAFISVLPVANLVSPVLATALMLHLFDGFPEIGTTDGERGERRWEGRWRE